MSSFNVGNVGGVGDNYRGVVGGNGIPLGENNSVQMTGQLYSPQEVDPDSQLEEVKNPDMVEKQEVSATKGDNSNKGRRTITTKDGKTITIGKNNDFRAMMSKSEYEKRAKNPNMARRAATMDRQRIIAEIVANVKPTVDGTPGVDAILRQLGSKEDLERYIQQNGDKLSSDQVDALRNNIDWEW